MIVNFMQKLIALILSALISAGIIAPAPIPPDGVKANSNFVFANEEAGSAEGTAMVTANFDATYELYWGDAQGNKLTTSSPSGKIVPYSWFAQVDVKKGKGEQKPFFSIIRISFLTQTRFLRKTFPITVT